MLPRYPYWTIRRSPSNLRQCLIAHNNKKSVFNEMVLQIRIYKRFFLIWHHFMAFIQIIAHFHALQWEPASLITQIFIHFFPPSLLMDSCVNNIQWRMPPIDLFPCFIFSRCSASASMVVHPHHILLNQVLFRSHLRAWDQVFFGFFRFDSERARASNGHSRAHPFFVFFCISFFVSKFVSFLPCASQSFAQNKELAARIDPSNFQSNADALDHRATAPC